MMAAIMIPPITDPIAIPAIAPVERPSVEAIKIHIIASQPLPFCPKSQHGTGSNPVHSLGTPLEQL